jgi:UDP-2,3-diacylglucosamine hydrolase
MVASADRNDAGDAAPVAIICGGGALPFAVADAALRGGRKVVLFAIKGWADPAHVVRYRHHWIALGQFGRGRRLAAAEGCRQVAFIGGVIRPALHEIRLDWQTLRLLPRLARLYRGGDDQLLSGIGRIFQEHGLELIGAHELAADIIVPSGPIGQLGPTPEDAADIARGLAVLSALGRFDIGQAVVVANNQVLAVEAAEGTDYLLARIAELKQAGRIRSRAGTGVLVKAPKPGQNLRLDLPAIGPQTVAGVIRAGLAGLAVVAGGAIMAEPERVAAAADAGRVFVVGVNPP